jgi:hypothetical protein
MVIYSLVEKNLFFCLGLRIGYYAERFSMTNGGIVHGPNQLLSSAVEMALDLLEKHGSFLPYCKAVNATGELFIYSPASSGGKDFTEAQASESVRFNVLRDLEPRGLAGLAFCHHTRLRFADSDEKVPALEVELHYHGQPAAVWYFPYKMEGNTANVLEYYSNEAKEDLFTGRN